MADPKILVTFKNGCAAALAPAGEPPTSFAVEEGRLYKRALERCYPNMFVLGVTARQAGHQATMFLRIGPKNDEGFLGGETKPIILLTPTDIQEMKAA